MKTFMKTASAFQATPLLFLIDADLPPVDSAVAEELAKGDKQAVVKTVPAKADSTIEEDGFVKASLNDAGEVVDKTGRVIKEGYDSAVETVSETANTVSVKTEKAVKDTKEFVVKTYDNVTKKGGNFYDSTKVVIGTAVKDTKEFADETFDIVSVESGILYNKAGDQIGIAADAVEEAADSVGAKTKRFFKNLFGGSDDKVAEEKGKESEKVEGKKEGKE